MKNMDIKNKIKNLNEQEIKRKTLTQSPMRRVGIVSKTLLTRTNMGLIEVEKIS